MKSEERHKLQQNALAEWLNETFVAIRPYQNAIVAVIIVLILAVIFFVWWTSESASQSSKTWTQLFTAVKRTIQRRWKKWRKTIPVLTPPRRPILWLQTFNLPKAVTCFL